MPYPFHIWGIRGRGELKRLSSLHTLSGRCVRPCERASAAGSCQRSEANLRYRIMAGIFISYRREDSGGHAGRLYDRLQARFGGEHKLFWDVETLQAGDDFPMRIRETVASCCVLIAVIGKNWLSAADEQGQPKLRNAGDWVSIEIRAALKRNISIIPVLVGGAVMPRSHELPRGLARLADRHALQIHDANFDQGMNQLIDWLEKSLGFARQTRVSDRRSAANSLPESSWLLERPPKPVEPAAAAGDKKLGKDGLVYQWIPAVFEYSRASPGGSGFWIASDLVTIENYRRVTGTEAALWGIGGAPALLSYSEAREYCERIDGRLPTRDELERAPRAALPPVLLASRTVLLWTSDLQAGSAFLRAVLKQ